jgi:hypothetical protein
MNAETAPMRERLRRYPRAGLAIALIAFVNAIAWSLIVPPFQVPDEPSHFYYATYLAQTGKLPRLPPPDPSVPSGSTWYSAELNGLLGAGGFYLVIGHPENRPPAGDGARALRAYYAKLHLDSRGIGDASSATSNPPVYYLVQAAVDKATPFRSPLDRLMSMRVISALMGALTVLCVFAFLREVLPRSPWAWTVGALFAALEPMVGFMSAGVNNDAALYLTSAALLLALARLMRRGLSRRRLLAAGLAFSLGVLVKTQALAFLPAVALAAGYAWWWGKDRSPRRTAVAAITLAAAVALPLAVYFVLGHTVWQRPLVDRVGELSGATPKPFTVREYLSYTLQLYLPRLPFLADLFPGDAPYDLWFKGLLGEFGWLDYRYPGWVYPVVLVLTTGVVLLAIRALVAGWPQLRRRLPELLVYLVFGAGLAGAVALAGYRSRVLGGVPFEQGRYLLPLLGLFAGLVALGVRGAGRRLGPAVGAAVVMIMLGLDVAAQLLTLGRYYG